MTRYVAFLRGVNVAGINIKMADLRKVFAQLGFENARTILASGNVVFESGRRDRAKLKKQIEAALNAAFGYEAWIVLVDIETLTRIVAAYPFDAEHEGWQPYVLMSSDPAPLNELAELAPELDPALERIELGDGVLYWEVERGQTLNSPFGKATGKKRYKSMTTNRNLRTLRKVLA
jgi:uncharacterized protein (DUF1697 family)